MAIMRRAFQFYGHFCASHPWEILTAMVTTIICIVTMYHQPLGNDEMFTKNSLRDKDYLGAGMLAMTMMRCGSILYCFRQVKMLNRMGSRYVPGIAAVFAIHCSILLCTMLIKCFEVDLRDLRDAIFVFVFLLDIGRASLLAQFSLLAKSHSEIHQQIGKGMGFLGPEITLDTLVEVLVIGVGTLSGLRKLELLCYFACISVLVRYLVFLTFYPAILSLFLELSKCHERPGREQFVNLNKVFSDEESKPNPVVERVKLIMAIGLSVVHLRSRWGGQPAGLWGPSETDDLLGCFGNGLAGQELEFPFTFIRWLSANAEHLVLLTLLGTLVAKSVLAKGEVEEFRLALLNADREQKASEKLDGLGDLRSEDDGTPHLSRVFTWADERALNPPLFIRKCQSSDSCLRTRTRPKPKKMSLACFVTRNRDGLQRKGSAGEAVADFFARDRTVSSTSSNITFVLGDSGGSSDDDGSQTAEKTTQTEKDGAGATEDVVENGAAQVPTRRRIVKPVARPIRPMEVLLRLMNGDQSGGPEELTDEEVLHLIKHNQLNPRSLESALGDSGRGVRIRRDWFKMSMSLDIARGLEALTFEDYNYDLVNGACCENVVGYVGVPIGLAGPLIMDGEKIWVPMATTEGCLVASTNRGCNAITKGTEYVEQTPPRVRMCHYTGPLLDYKCGVQTSLTYDGMTRGPLVRFPSAREASECSNWVNTEAGFSFVADAFNETSRFARLKKLSTCLAGRLLFIRFVAKTGDAMGMNMLSKGSEQALKALNEKFRTMEILSVSGNYCADKKVAAVNWIEGRGKSVVCEARIPGSIIKDVLKSDVESLVELNTGKNLVGSAMAGSIGGFNAHAANIVAAIYIACGQDPAQVIASANCLTWMEKCGPTGEDLYISVTMPSLEVGTVGGGTILPAQASCLKLLGVYGPSADQGGANAQKFARIVGSAVLAGELSLMSALASGHLVKSHLKHNRSSVFMLPPSGSVYQGNYCGR